MPVGCEQRIDETFARYGGLHWALLRGYLENIRAACSGNRNSARGRTCLPSRETAPFPARRHIGQSTASCRNSGSRSCYRSGTSLNENGTHLSLVGIIGCTLHFCTLTCRRCRLTLR